MDCRTLLYPSCIVAPRYWRVLVLSGCLFKSEIGKSEIGKPAPTRGNRKSEKGWRSNTPHRGWLSRPLNWLFGINPEQPIMIDWPSANQKREHEVDSYRSNILNLAPALSSRRDTPPTGAGYLRARAQERGESLCFYHPALPTKGRRRGEK